MRCPALLLALLLAFVATGPASAAAPDPAYGPWLSRAVAERPNDGIRVWVHFRDKGLAASERPGALARVSASWNEATRERRAAAGAGPSFTDLPVHEAYVAALRDRGFAVRRVSRWLNAASVVVPAARVPELAALPFVRFVQPVRVKLARNVPPEPEPEDLLAAAAAPDSAALAAFYGSSFDQNDQLGVVDLHQAGYTGAGVKVLLLDTGFKWSHPAFQTCTDLVAQYDFVNDDGNVENEGSDPITSHGHGTGTWGTLGGYAPGNLIGPAFGASFYLAKTEDVTQEVHAEEDDYVAALEWGDTLGVEVVSASLAYLTFDDGNDYTFADLDGDTAVITVAVDLAVQKGMAVANAVGNSGPGVSSLWTPSDADSVIAVGAVSSTGIVGTFSARGPTFDGRTKPEVVARGVLTTWARASTDGYGQASGTSLSTPLIGGLCALLKEAHPTWDGATIRDALMTSGDNALTPNNDVGWGVPNGPAAILHGGAIPEPPRRTLPFTLAEPADSAAVPDPSPTLRWCASEALQPGDAAQYRVLYVLNGAPEDTIVAGPDTSVAWPGALAPGDTVTWRVEAIGNLGYVRKSLDERLFAGGAIVDVPAGPRPPVGLALGPAFPNPTGGSTRLSFRAPEGERVTIRLVAVTGRTVRILEAVGTGGDDALSWDGRDDAGRMAPPGVYFYRLENAPGIPARKLVRLP